MVSSKERDNWQSQLPWQERENHGRFTTLKSLSDPGVWYPWNPQMAEIIWAAFCFLIPLQIAQPVPWTPQLSCRKSSLQDRNYISLPNTFTWKYIHNFVPVEFTGKTEKQLKLKYHLLLLCFQNCLHFQICKECVHLPNTTLVSNGAQVVMENE